MSRTIKPFTRRVLRVSVLLLLLLTFISTEHLEAQSIWLDRSSDKAVGLEILKVDFEGDADNIDFATISFVRRHDFDSRIS